MSRDGVVWLRWLDQAARGLDCMPVPGSSPARGLQDLASCGVKLEELSGARNIDANYGWRRRGILSKGDSGRSPSYIPGAQRRDRKESGDRILGSDVSP